MLDLFEDLYETNIPVRLFGVGASRFSENKEELKQLTLFDELDAEEKAYNINKLLKNINDTFGGGIIKKGVNKEKDHHESINTDKYDKKWAKEARSEIRSLNKR